MAITSYKLPTSVIQNGTGVNAWADPNNILLVDGDFAVASGPASEILVGGFNISLGQLDTITNITLKVKGYRGSYNTTLAIYAVDDTSGVEISYPYAPSFQGFDGTNTLYTLASSLFSTTWTPDQINNIKIKLIADGTLYLDAIEMAVTYTPGVTPVPVGPSSGEIVVDEFVQGQRFQLAQAMTSTDLFLFAESFNLPDGTPIEYGDFHGEALITVDQGIPGSEENIRISDVEQDYNGTGLCRISIASLADRGLGFIYPYESDATRIKAHGGTAEFVISNSAPFYNRFLRKNQIDALVSAPIYISDENVQLTDPAHELDFRGSGVTVVNDGSDSFKKIVTIQGTGVSTPVVVNTSSSTTGDAQAATLTWSHVSSGIDRLLVVQVITEAAKTITGITYNGIALTQEVTATNGTLRSEQWILVAPTIGTYDVVVTMSASAYITAGAETFTSVNQSVPTGATSTATGSSLLITDSIATTVDNSIIVDAVGTGVLPMAYTVGAGQSSNWAITANPNVRQGASSIEGAGTSPDNITMSWAITQSTPWVTTSLEICGIPSVVNSGVLSVTGLNTDNTDPQNPIVEISVDGSTITGDGTPGSPLVATAGAGASLVKATAADTTAGYLDDKIEIVSADSSVTITPSITNPGGNEKVSYDLSVPVSSTVSSLGDQIICTLQEDSNQDNGFCSATSTTNGAENFLVNYNNDTQSSEVRRFEKDTITGKYYLTHTSTSISIDDISVSGIQVTPAVVLGNYVYVFGRAGLNLKSERLDKADLQNATNMTISTVAFAPCASWTDGTNIFLMNSAGAVKEYSVSGTTLTFVQDLTGGPTNSIGAFFDSSSIKFTDTSNNIMEYTISGTTLVSGASIQRTFSGLINSNVPPVIVGMFYTDLNTFNYVYSQNWLEATSAGGDEWWTAITKGFSRP